MLIFENGLRIVFENGFIRKTGVIKAHVEDIYEGKKYLVNIYENGKLSDKSDSVFEHQILQVYIKDAYDNSGIWVKIGVLYASYPNRTVIGPNTKYKNHVDGRNPWDEYPWGQCASRYILNDEKAAKAAIREYHLTPKKVIFNGPATVVIWLDGTKTIVKKSEDDADDREKAVMYAILKKEFGSRAKMNRYLKQFFKEVESNEEKKEEAGSRELHWKKQRAGSCSSEGTV